MDNKIVLRKTAKGRNEIKSRAEDLAPKLRFVLVMVNGTLSVAELQSQLNKMSRFDDANEVSRLLQELVDRKFVVDAINSSANERSEFVSQKWNSQQVSDTKSLLISRANDVLGKHADKVINKIESSPNTTEGLLNAIDSGEKIVKLFIDEALAKQLSRQWQRIISKQLFSK